MQPFFCATHITSSSSNLVSDEGWYVNLIVAEPNWGLPFCRRVEMELAMLLRRWLLLAIHHSSISLVVIALLLPKLCFPNGANINIQFNSDFEMVGHDVDRNLTCVEAIAMEQGVLHMLDISPCLIHHQTMPFKSTIYRGKLQQSPSRYHDTIFSSNLLRNYTPNLKVL